MSSRTSRDHSRPSASRDDSTILDARRPSWTPSLPPTRSLLLNIDGNESPEKISILPQSQKLATVPSSPEDAGNFRKSLEIDMKGLVGDAVGNMSISPASRDVVLAARRGLFIIDLEAPLELPRFLPQGGTWDVADVQWNPHHSHAEYIVSTSSEKLLIWNLHLAGKTSIQHILYAHYRAITDINWHNTECDTVISSGIDSWLWAWDLREPKKPTFGLCAFNSAGTQVKWNYHDPDLLASSHGNEVLIWDRRKGSLPICTIPAHTSKIYGIDWSRHASNEIVTCSLDKTVKLWNINDCAPPDTGFHSTFESLPSPTGVDSASTSDVPKPKWVINTAYPVWRARNLPFGRGVLSLPQRGETTLDLYAASNTKTPVERFEGHTDVVKEFVWRRGGVDNTDFQLITWSMDRTLRFWPVDADTMREVGFVPPISRGRSHRSVNSTSNETQYAHPASTNNMSFRTRPPRDHESPLLSAPIGSRAILAEVRAGLPTSGKRQQTNVALPYPTWLGSDLRKSIERPSPPTVALNLTSTMRNRDGTLVSGNMNFPHSHSFDIGNISSQRGDSSSRSPRIGTVELAPPIGSAALPIKIRNTPNLRTGTMSRGGVGGKSSLAKMDPLTWLSNVKVGERRRGSSSGGRGSRGDSAEASRIGSRSRRGSSGYADAVAGAEDRRRSESVSRSGAGGDEKAESSQSWSLQDEITTVLNKLSASKIKLEKHDLTKRRTCTLGLHGPWGENSSVFIRVSFTFPKEYPNGVHPEGTPTIDLERNPLISMQDRAFILRRLRLIRERERPCLEACLRFLLFGTMGTGTGTGTGGGGEVDTPGGAGAITTDYSSDELEDDENVGARGKKSRDVTVSMLRNNKSLAEPRSSQGTFGPNGELVCFFRAPPRIVRNVLRESSESPAKNAITPQHEPSLSTESVSLIRSPALLGDAIRRLTMASVDGRKKPSTSYRHREERILKMMTNFLTFSQHRLRRESESKSLDSGSRTFALMPPLRRSTVFITSTVDITGGDKKVAREYVFLAESLEVLCRVNAEVARKYRRYDHERVFRALEALLTPLQVGEGLMRPTALMRRMVNDILLDFKQAKDLQMLAMVSMVVLQAIDPEDVIKDPLVRSPPVASRHAPGDYFGFIRSKVGSSPVSPPWSRQATSPGSHPLARSLSSSNSSRGSWSSLFNTGAVKQLMSGVQETLNQGFVSPSDMTPLASSKPLPVSGRTIRGPDSPLPRRAPWKDALSSSTTASKSWNDDSVVQEKLLAPAAISGTQRPALHSRPNSGITHLSRHGDKVIVFHESPSVPDASGFTAQEVTQLAVHAQVYAEMLFRWEFLTKRLELLKSIEPHLDKLRDGHEFISLSTTCAKCGRGIVSEKNICSACSQLAHNKPACSICRLPIKGLAQTCIRCLHVAHVPCWKRLKPYTCPLGCGCSCDERG